MHGLSQDVDVSFCVGQTLSQICFGPHDLILNFHAEKSATISIWSSIGCIGADGVSEKFVDLKKSADFVLHLLNLTVQSATIPANGTLSLGFEDGTYLEIYDDSDRYESYSFHFAGRATYV